MEIQQKHIPKLRFPEFQNDGEWEVKRLGDVCQLTNGMAFKPSDWKETGIPIVRIQNLNDESAPFNYCTPETVDDRCMIDNGTLLFSWSGTPGTSFGAYIWNRGKAVLNQHIFIVKPVEIDKVFLKMTIDANMTSIIEKSHGGAGLRHITKSDFEDVRVYVPKDISEQQRIAIALSEIDTLLSATNVKLEQLKAYKKGLMQILFPAQGKTVPEYRFKEFEKDGEWEVKKLGEIVGIYDGIHQTPNYTNKGVMFISVEDISTLKSNKYISEEDFYRDFKVYPQRGDILMTRIGDIGTANVYDSDELLAYYVSLALFKPKSINSYFLKHTIDSYYFQYQLSTKTLHIAFPKKINKKELESVLVYCPSISEQRKIAKCFMSIDEAINAYTEKFTKLGQYKKGLMQQMFPNSK